MSKVLVTGGAGFIGSNLVDKLIDLGHEVVVIDNESSVSNDKFFWNDKAAVAVKEDICDYDKTRQYYDGVDYVFHLAAKSRIHLTLSDPAGACNTNLVGTCIVLRCCQEAGVKRIMYSSTSSAYGLKNQPPLQEDMRPDVLNPYSISKVAGEEMCKIYNDMFDLETVTFRYFNVYGKREPIKGQYAPVTGIFIRQKKAGQELTITGDGEQRRDFTHVDDIVKANISAMTAENVAGELINVGAGYNYSVNELADMVGGPKKYIPARPGEARITLADTTKLEKLLKFTTTSKLKEYIADSLL